MGSASQFQFAAFIHPQIGTPRIGNYSLESQTIQPLSFDSGTPISDLYQVIEAGVSRIVQDGAALALKELTLLPPITGRDVLAVGKNYAEHAKEFNGSGFDSSDTKDQPTHPVIFTKRFTSIIADGEDIFPHLDFTSTLDYEGEVGVIIGKSGFRIRQENALDHVWGYTIINDMTARERQRDHKQFFLGKSPDTFCPMGPVAVPKEQLPLTLQVQTRVNGELRQNATTDDLIFSVATLIKTISEGQTLQAGDVIATGTPAGVGIGKKPPVYLRAGDEVAVSVTGLGTLRNKIGLGSSTNPTVSKVEKLSSIPLGNSARSLGNNIGLTTIGTKSINYQKLGSGGGDVVFVHGLGGTQDYWTPLVSALGLDKSHSLHLFDFEGHGLSPVHALSDLTIQSLAGDVRSVFDHVQLSPSRPATLVAHSMGCLVALQFTLDNPSLVEKLILIGPPPSPLPRAASDGTLARAALVRSKGMNAVVDAVISGGTSEVTKKENPVAVAAVRVSLLSQDPESYAKACWALARATEVLDVEKIRAKTLILTGDEDKVSPPSLCKQYTERISQSELTVLKGTGHWHVYENIAGVAKAVSDFL